MAASRHKISAAQGWRKNAARLALPTAGIMAMAVAGVAVITSDTSGRINLADADLLAAAAPQDLSSISRSAERPALDAVSVEASGTLWVTGETDVRADADGESPVLASVAPGDQVTVTGETDGDWTQIIHKDLPRWVATKDLSDVEPLGTAPCPYGSERGLLPDTVKVLRAVCAKFPSVTRYGGLAGRGEHATGHALDIMVRGPLGDEIAAFLQENRAALGIEYLIWEQRIWRPATSPNWRGMKSRGGATANHFDHVHVTTYGNAATR